MTESSGPTDIGVHLRVTRQASRSPDRIAIVHVDQAISYAALEARSDEVARQLHAQGTRPDDVVAIAFERSIDMVIAILGALKAGAAYLPLDLGDPPERLAYVLADSRSQCVLTNAASVELVMESACPVIVMTSHGGAAVEGVVHDPPLSPANAAYVIYTSGSTGRPKGVLIPHAALSNHTDWLQTAFPLADDDIVLQKTPCAFDASVWELLSPLAAGARLVLALHGAHHDPAYLVRTIVEQRVTTLQVVPTQLSMLLAHPSWPRCRSLRRVFCGGEVLSRDLQRRFFEMPPACPLVNLYGPTECTIDASAWECRPQTMEASVPIGRPIEGVSAHVLDRRLGRSPIGVPGDLYLGGAGLARGYAGRPALTAERFVPDPFSREPGARLYWTGDLARWDADGYLTYVGRVDTQIKLHGFRIELGEIEAVIADAPGVERAVAIVRPVVDDEDIVVAYVKGDGTDRRSETWLRDYLAQRLPVHMLPGRFVWIDELPLLANGKIDRARLPEPVDVSEDVELYVAPRNPVEVQIAEMWAELFGVERISMTARFFEQGGHSLMLIQLGSRIRETFNVDVPLRALFNAPTVPDMVDAVIASLAEATGAAQPL